jgi:adenine/guanine phosphoribosyltransferase-like PRPP-binding protein
MDEFWQSLLPASAALAPPFCDRFTARLPDGRVLLQPLRVLPQEPDTAVASLIATQLAFAVEHALAGWLAEVARRFAPEVIVGVPTLGMVFARPVAERLGFANWVALGYSRKFWYDDALSEPVSSVTSPVLGSGGAKRLWLDPRMRARLEGRRIVVVDDVISTGASAAATLALLRRAGDAPAALTVAMIQGNRWQARQLGLPVAGVFTTPLFRRAADGWWPREETLSPTHVDAGAPAEVL